jgi:hypothetical protein
MPVWLCVPQRTDCGVRRAFVKRRRPSSHVLRRIADFVARPLYPARTKGARHSHARRAYRVRGIGTPVKYRMLSRAVGIALAASSVSRGNPRSSALPADARVGWGYPYDCERLLEDSLTRRVIAQKAAPPRHRRLRARVTLCRVSREPSRRRDRNTHRALRVRDVGARPRADHPSRARSKIPWARCTCRARDRPRR